MSSFRKKREHKRERERQTEREKGRQTDRQTDGEGENGTMLQSGVEQGFHSWTREGEKKTAAAGSAEWGNFLKRLACGDLSICDFPESQTFTSV